METTVPHGKLYLSCKKEGCTGVLCVAKSSRHGAAFQCSRCLNKQKFCQDCQQLYINFRRHRQLGHELYEFQRKRQVLMRNNHGLFVPGKFLPNNPDEKSNAAAAVMAAGAQPQQTQHALPMQHMGQPDPFSTHVQNYFHHSLPMSNGVAEDGAQNGRRVVRRGENSRIAANGGPKDRMDVVELEDASDILVKLLHSSKRSMPGMSPYPTQQVYPAAAATSPTKHPHNNPSQAPLPPQPSPLQQTTRAALGVPPPPMIWSSQQFMDIKSEPVGLAAAGGLWVPPAAGFRGFAEEPSPSAQPTNVLHV